MYSIDDELPINKVEMTFLHRKITWQWLLAEEKHMVDVEYFFMGPCSPDLQKNGAYKFDNLKANHVFRNVIL